MTTIEHFRHRAEEMRSIASQYKHPVTFRMLMQNADDYDAIADRMERMALIFPEVVRPDWSC